MHVRTFSSSRDFTLWQILTLSLSTAKTSSSVSSESPDFYVERERSRIKVHAHGPYTVYNIIAIHSSNLSLFGQQIGAPLGMQYQHTLSFIKVTIL